MVGYVATGIIFAVLESPKSFTGTRHVWSCLIIILNIAAREYPRAGSKQMATYEAVVAQTQSSSSSSNLCCSVATQKTWSAHHVACSLLHTIHYASSMDAVWRTPIQPRPQTALLLLLLYIFSRQQHACCTSLSPSIFPTLCIFSTKNQLAKLKGLLRVQPNGRRKDEPQRGFISVRYYEV